MEPKLYQMKRNSLIMLCFILTLVYIIFAARAPTFVDKYIEASDQQFSDREANIVIVRILSVLGIAVQLCGLVGASRGDFCLSVIYIVCQILGFMAQVGYRINCPIDWAIMVPLFAFTPLAVIVAILLLLDISTIQNTGIAYQSTI